MRAAIPLLAVTLLAGCAQQPKAPRTPVQVAPSPICTTTAQCSAGWIKAHDQLQTMTGMRLAVASDTYIATYPMRRLPNMVGEAYKIDNGDGTHTIKARFTCRNGCDGLDQSAENLFNTTVGMSIKYGSQ